MTRRQYQDFMKAQQQETYRVKMYKAKKQWITAGITAFSMAIGLTAMSATTTHAATVNWSARSTEAIQASLKSKGTTPYTIVWGDTLSTIADAANRSGIETSVGRLAEINKISNIDLIFAGNTLWFNGSGSNGTVNVTDKNGNTHTFNLDPNKPVQSNNGNGTSVHGGAQSNTNNSSTANNGSGSSSNNNNSVNNGSNNNSNSSDGSNANNGTGNNSNNNASSNNGNNGSNGNNSNNNGNSNNNNNGNGTTDPTTPINPSKDEVTYKINFINYADHDKIIKTVDLKGKIGEKISYTADVEIDVDGVHYVLGSSAEIQHSITLDKDANKNVINVKYQPQALPDKTSYIVNYVDEAGKPVAKFKKIDNVKMMSDITEYAPQIDGYTVKNSNVISTILTEENQVLTFVYAKTTAPTTKTDVNIHFVDENNKEIAPTKKAEGNVGDIFTASALSIDGYKLNGDATQSIKLSKSDNNITFHYTKAVAPVEKTSYTVSYQTADGTKLEADKVVNDQEVGKQVTEKAHTIKGYKLTSQATQTMTLSKSGNHITFTYAKEEAPVAKTTYTVSYQAEDGTKLQADKTVNDQKVGTAVTETAPTIDGYTIKGEASQTMVLAKDNNHLTFTYTKNAETGVNVQAISNKLTQLVNEERQRVGVAPLAVNNKLIQVATTRAQQLSEKFEHDGPVTIALAEKAGYKGGVVENAVYDTLGIGETNDEMAQDLFDGWKEDAPHYAVMIGNGAGQGAIDTGIGVYANETGQVYASQIFGTGENTVETSSVTSKYMDETGREIASQEVQVGNVGDKFTLTAKKIAGYTLVGSETQTGTYTKEGSVITFKYKSDTPVNVDHSTPVNAPAGTPGLLDGDSTPAGNTHNIWFYADNQVDPAGQTKSNLFFATMQDATNFAEKYLDDTMLEPNPLFNGYAVNQIFGDGTTPIAYTIYWR